VTARKAKHDDDDPNAYRVQPHDLDAEKSVLGAILVNNAAFERAAQHIRARDFFRRAHQAIFEVCAFLIDEQRMAADFVTVKDELTKRNALEECGGPAYISSLTDGVPRSANIQHYARIVLEKSRLRQIIKTGQTMTTAAYDAEKAASEIIQAADRAIIGLQHEHGGRLLDLRETHQALYADLEQREQNKGQLTGVDTGFASINDLTLGWQAGELIVIAARPSIGKTAFTLHTAMAAAKAGKTVAIFSMEMRRRQLEYRMLAALSGIALTRLQSGYLGEPDYERLTPAMATLAAMPIYIDDRSGQTVMDIRTACRLMKAEHALDLIVIDYVQLMPGTLEKRAATRNEEVTDISRKLKILTDEVNAPILLLSQLNRGADGRADPRPKLSDLRESGALEQDADKVVFLHRKHHRESGVTNVIVEKDRNGPGGTLNVTFTRDNQVFVDGGEEPAPEPKPEGEAKPKKPRPIWHRKTR
jgi:replicative DNA helicase